MRRIYKICPASAWREAERQGVYPRQRRRYPRRLYPFFHGLAGGGDGEETFLRPDRAVPDRRSMPTALGDAPALGALAQRRAVPASLWRTRSRRGRGVLDMRARSDGTHDIPELDAVIRAFDAFSLPLLRWFDPEDAHRWRSRACACCRRCGRAPDDPKLAVRAFGLNFPNPIGMAAGFDKSAEAPDALLRLGFGFVEIGSVTPKPQAGNPRPRLFRLERDEAVINRMGFNNDGARSGAAAARRARASGRHRRRQCRRQQGFRRPRRRLCQADRDLRAGRELFHRQRVVAEYAGPAQSAAGRRARRSAGQGDRRARAGAARTPAIRRCCSRSRPI